MTESNKILLKTLLTIEFELNKTQNFIENNHLFLSISFNSNQIYDLFETIISAFYIPDTSYDTLYDLLNSLCSNKITIDETLNSIEKLIK